MFRQDLEVLEDFEGHGAEIFDFAQIWKDFKWHVAEIFDFAQVVD